MDIRRPTAPRGAAGLRRDSDASSMDSLKDLMAASQRGAFRHGATREADLLFAAKHARAQAVPAAFREPPSSTGSHGTVTLSSIHVDDYVDDYEDGTASTFSAGPDAESTRASLHYQRGQHRVKRSTGRYGGSQDGTTGLAQAKAKTTAHGKNGTTSDALAGVVNTSALFRTFKEWRPAEEASHRGADEAFDGHLIREDSTNMGVLDALDKYQYLGKYGHENKENKENKENRAPPHKSPKHGRGVLQATVQNESDMSAVMSGAAPASKAAQAVASPLRAVSAAASKAAVRHADKQGSRRGHGSAAAPLAVLEEDLTTPETSADSHEQARYGGHKAAAVAETRENPENHENHDGLTNQSFLLPSKSFPLLHNLVTGTLRFTPGTVSYGADEKPLQAFRLPSGRVPADEKKIFIDVDKIREEVVRLQEHDEMLQNEIVQGERKYHELMDRFYALAAKVSDSGFDSESDRIAAQEEEQQEWNRAVQDRVLALETSLEAAQKHGEEMAAQRDAAKSQIQQLHAELAVLRERLAHALEAVETAQTAQTAQAAQMAARPSQEAQRRIRQLEQMVAERERVIQALRDEGEAAASSHREASRLLRERMVRLSAEARMARGDHSKCAEQKQAAAAARTALEHKQAAAQAVLAQKNAALREKYTALRMRAQEARRQAREREVALREVVERQRTQVERQQAKVRSRRDKGVQQLDEAFRRLRASLEEETTATVTVDVQEKEEQEEEEEVEEDDLEEDDGLGADLDKLDDLDSPTEHVLDDMDRLAPSEDGLLVDENMTSAFILPDIDLAEEEATEGEDEPAEEADVDQAGVEHMHHTHHTHHTQDAHTHHHAKSVTFQTDRHSAHTVHDRFAADATACRHSRTNCVVCRQQKGPPTAADERVTVAVPRPALDLQSAAEAPTDPGRALAYVIKLLDDERRHLWMRIEASRRSGGPPSDAASDTAVATAANGGAPSQRRPAQRESDALWQAYVRKVEQLNRLDDVVAGQQAAGQAMTRAEVDVTITRILGEVEEW